MLLLMMMMLLLLYTSGSRCGLALALIFLESIHVILNSAGEVALHVLTRPTLVLGTNMLRVHFKDARIIRDCHVQLAHLVQSTDTETCSYHSLVRCRY